MRWTERNSRTPLEQNGFICLITDPDLPSGTDRIAQANQSLQKEEILNVQADEPMVTQAHVLALTKALKREGADLATLATPIHELSDFHGSKSGKSGLGPLWICLVFFAQPNSV